MGLRFWGKIAATLLLAVIFVAPVQATMYSYTDDNGVVHFTNVPGDAKYRPIYKSQRSGAIAITGSGRQMFPARKAAWTTAPDPDSFDAVIRTVANRHQVDPRLIKSVIRAESNFDYLAVSRKGALGLMQLMPETAEDMQVNDPFDPKDNIEGGTRYLRKMLGIFNGNLRMALAAYNAGPNRVIKLGKVPNFRETTDYVHKVQLFYEEYKEQSSPHKRWAKYYYDGNS